MQEIFARDRILEQTIRFRGEYPKLSEDENEAAMPFRVRFTRMRTVIRSRYLLARTERNNITRWTLPRCGAFKFTSTRKRSKKLTSKRNEEEVQPWQAAH